MEKWKIPSQVPANNSPLVSLVLPIESAEFQSPSPCKEIKTPRGMHFHGDEKSGNSWASSDGLQGMKEVGDDVFSHPYLQGVFLLHLEMLLHFDDSPSTYKQWKVLLKSFENGKWKIPSQVPANHSPGRIAAQQEPKHSNA
ncbi:hypothetical protein CEXT_774421 [Caerostris extrusa]|uniref:Uncharacterized protein n=1 Tax=Caerostris extrusa TaxID=172846 RepID=A0AAV4X1E0_CAEEX|nr:hypothetical protein CEXT_774421 [Caerostris extrusa]